MSTDKSVWMVNVNDTESSVKVPNLPEGNVRSVSFGNTHANIVKGDGKLLISKIKDGNVEEWKQPPDLTRFESIQVESGLSHHVAITTDNKLVSWGKNDLGQLGRGDVSTKKGERKNVVFSASSITFFQSMRICAVSCGNLHTLCLTEEGQVYSWGSNDCNQLGLGNTSTLLCTKPQLVEDLAGTPITQISAGGQHSFVLSKTGLVFCWGSNRFGQLGFENRPTRSSHCYQVEFPAQCVEKARLVSCGENHTAFLAMDGHVYTCGLGSSGQLGHHPSTENQFIPREIEELHNKPISRIACGRDYTVVYIQSTNALHYFGAQRKCVINLPRRLEDPTLRCGKDFFFIYQLQANDGDVKIPVCQPLTLDTVMNMMRNPGEYSDHEIEDMLRRTLSQASCVNASFQSQNNGTFSSESCHHVDLDAADEFFNEVRKPSYSGIAEQALKKLMKSLLNRKIESNSLHMFLLLPCCLYVKRSRLYCDHIVISLSKRINSFQRSQTSTLGKWLKSISTDHFKRYVLFFRRCLERYFSRFHKILDPLLHISMTLDVESCIKVLDMLNEVNKHRSKPIPYHKFYLKNLADALNITGDYLGRLEDIKSNKLSTFRFCKYLFLYGPASKDILLKSQCMKMMKPYTIGFFGLIFHHTTALKVRRYHLLMDTRERLSVKEDDLLKRLDVTFEDEIEYSGNGIRQEFFQLLIEKLLDKTFGAFYYEEESNLQWFRVQGEKETSNLADIRFVGVICGLALYNGVTLHLQFPSALYKKLLDKPVSFEDLFDLMPVQYRSCKYLLEYHYDDIEDMCFDFANPTELCPNGANIPVNHSNKEDYVDKVTKYYLNTMAQKEFEIFQEGFYTAMPKALLMSFQPTELQEILVGNERYDFKAIEETVGYSKDYHRNHKTIEMFWEVFHDMELQDQKKFLTFLTGTYRVPAYGLKGLGINIIPLEPEEGADPDEMFPHAMTCTNLLLLPRYTNKESLERMVIAAIQLCTGFGLP